MKRALIVLLFLVLVSGCTTYYKVTDPGTGKEYYTTNIDYKSNGAVELKDEKTGDKVVLQSSEVKEILKEEFNQGIYAK